MATLLPTLLFALSSAAPICGGDDGWRAGLAAREAAPDCRDDAYLEAHRLGHELRRLRDEHASLSRTLSDLAEAAGGATRRRMRQIDVDVEAIHALATVNGWPLGTGEDAAR